MSLIDDVFIIGVKYSVNNIDLEDKFKSSIQNLQKDIENLNKDYSSTLIVLSTCNRFEIIGKGNVALIKTELFKLHPILEQIAMIKKGDEAMYHLFTMPSGLDSNILGDVEILGQFKHAYKIAKEKGRVCKIMERLVNTSLQSAKEIRQKTDITNGTTSLSYASIQILKDRHIDSSNSILLIGLGSFGKNIARNIKHYFPSNKLVLANRTLSKSKALSEELNCQYITYSEALSHTDDYDIIIAAVSHQGENQNIINTTKAKVIIDLSVPAFFKKDMQRHNVALIDIDAASLIINKSIANRKKSLPKANTIIQKHIVSFKEWLDINHDYLKKWKNEIEKISQSCDKFNQLEETESKKIWNKSVGDYVVHIKNHKEHLDSNTMILDFLDNTLTNKCIIEKYADTNKESKCEICQRRYV